ncbi:MAG TPA: hypothetical protein VF677_04305 [Flavobacterium sp.]
MDGIHFNNLEALRVTLGLQKTGTSHTLRQSVDLYNDTTVEKLTRKIAERLEIGTTIVRHDLDALTNSLEEYWACLKTELLHYFIPIQTEIIFLELK